MQKKSQSCCFDFVVSNIVSSEMGKSELQSCQINPVYSNLHVLINPVFSDLHVLICVAAG